MIIRSLLWAFCFSIALNIYGQEINRFNKKRERTGKWITYTDASHTKKLSEIYYRNGNVVRTAKYYNTGGQLERVEKKKWKKIKTAIYYPGTNVIRNKGNARIVVTKEKVHYFFYGKWIYYSEDGKPFKYVYYNKGQIVKTEYADKSVKLNDSLIGLLINLDDHFKKTHAQMIDSIAYSWSSPKLAEKFRRRIYEKDSSSFFAIEKVFERYGYATKEICGENATIIPFFIMNYAPLEMREKYMEFFKAAAGTGKLDKPAVAYYIDKIKVAKGEKQVYATQFFMNKDRKTHYYPCEDMKTLNERRASMGLEPFNP